MDPKILPKEYGGEILLSEMIGMRITLVILPSWIGFYIILLSFSLHNVYLPAEFKKDLKDKKDQLKALDDMYIEISPKDCHAANNEELGGICGSFRKLEVD